MDFRALLVLLVSLVYFWGANKWYNTKHAGLCCQEQTVVVPPVVVEKEKDPLMFKWNDPSTITYKKFPELKSSILAGNKDGQILQITGQYFEGEVPPDGSGYADMGIARANEIWKTHFSNIPKERIEFLSNKVAERTGVRTDEFTSADFNWKAAVAKTVEELPDGVIVRFPYNATQKTVDAAIDDRLKKIAQRLKQNANEKVTITGHTDSDGTDESNMTLSDRRAKTVRDILIRYGVQRNRITTIPKGETQHVDTNNTDRGKAANRRAEVRITQ